LIYQKETLDAVMKFLSERRGHYRKEVKRYNKIKGKELVEFRKRRFTIDDYYTQMESLEWEFNRTIEEINALTKDDTHSQAHAVVLMRDTEVLLDILNERFPKVMKSSPPELSPVGIAAAILSQMGKKDDEGDAEEKTG
jgi:hypothetical protein